MILGAATTCLRRAEAPDLYCHWTTWDLEKLYYAVICIIYDLSPILVKATLPAKASMVRSRGLQDYGLGDIPFVAVFLLALALMH
jgi:hypothetical protein